MSDKLTTENLIKNGYRRLEHTHNYAQCLFQKRIIVAENLYFINIYYYPNYPAQGIDKFMPVASFKQPGYKHVEVRLGTDYESISEIERSFADYYKKFKCRSYE